jgi:predicted transcriptional regulator
MCCMTDTKLLKSMSTKNVQRSFRLSAELDELLREKAKQIDRSASWVVNRALEVALLGEDAAYDRAVVRSIAKMTDR